MKKLHVNREACIGCGACVAIDPEHFDFVDEYSDVISEENIESDAAKNAIASCPTNAISYIDGDEKDEDEHCEGCEKECCCKHDVSEYDNDEYDEAAI